MMLGTVYPMLPSRALPAILALGCLALPGCGPGTSAPESEAAAAATARALVRPHVARNALRGPPVRDASGASVTPGPTAVVLGHVSPEGAVTVGCVDSEDGAEALVRSADEHR